MYRKSTREIFFPDLYFRSGGKRIDFVIAYRESKVFSTQAKKDAFTNFLDNLQLQGIELEHEYFTENEDIGFIKIHAPHDILEGYADATNIDLVFKSPKFFKMHDIALSFFEWRRTPLSYADERSHIYHRAKSTIGRITPKKLTQAERILIVRNLMEDIRFGETQNCKGLNRLLLNGILEGAFPLHEGPTWQTKSGPLTDRQLLATYWGNLGYLVKEQPIYIIEKYFGPELAFYFEFVSFANAMLLIAGICSILFYLLGNTFEWDEVNKLKKTVCESEEYLCAECDPDICPLIPLKDQCEKFKESFQYDNVGTFLLSIFMSLWGTVFFELWARRKRLNIMKWNLRDVEYDTTMRVAYEENADALEVSPLTGDLEPVMSKTSLTWRFTAVTVFMSSLMGLILILVMAAILFKVTVKEYLKKNEEESQSFLQTVIASIIEGATALLNVFFMIIIDKIQTPSVRFMTDLENCRTQIEYDNSYILKLWLISFLNSFMSVFYKSFIVGIFYTNPGDSRIYDDFNAFRVKTCNPAGCNVDVVSLLFHVLLFKTLVFKCIKKIFLPLIRELLFRRDTEVAKRTVQWESDYKLRDVNNLSVMHEYAEIIGRITTVLFFSAVYPFAPLFTFVCNLLEVRFDAIAYTTHKRRPIPRKVSGLGVWNDILRYVLMVGVLINALTSILTQKYIKMVCHKFFYGTLDNYLSKRFSKFAIEDYSSEKIKQQVKNLTYCLYGRPYRFPPEHKNKYESSPERYSTYALAACFIVLYQHVVFVLTRIISKIIPNTSAIAEEHLNIQAAEEKKILRNIRKKEFWMSRTSLRRIPKVEEIEK